MSRIPFILSEHRRYIAHSLRSTFHRLRGAENGNVAPLVAICLVPMLIGVGAAIDTARMHNAYSRVQSDLDFALIAAVNEIGTEDTAKITAKLNDWFVSQQASGDYGTISVKDVKVNLQTDVVTATASGQVPTALMGLVGIDQMPVNVTSSAKGADKPHMQIYFAIDKSASMMLAATPGGQATMQREIGCAFACHTPEGDVGGTGYQTNYDYSQARGILLRSDIATQAISESLTVIQQADPDQQRIEVGLTRIGTTATEVLTPTSSLALVRQRLTQDKYGLTSASSDETTYFDVSLPKLAKQIGKSGDGHLATTPEKLVMIVTDGVESNRDWIFDTPYMTTPLNPKWCAGLKNAGVTVAVLYTEYLPMPWDWGYNATLGDTMASANWKATWDGDRRRTISGAVSRHDYIPYALKDCASSENLFLSASSQNEIEKGIKDLLRTFLSAPRLTQ